MNTILPKSLDYTDKDFASLRLRLQALIRAVFPGWTDFNVANFGDILLELFAFVGDVLTFYQDNQARESRLVTATQRQNVINLAKLLGYAPRGASAATTIETFSLAAPPTGTVTIPAGSVVQTADITSPVSFQLLADLVFAAHLNPPTLTATIENSASQVDTFTSSGLPDQTFALSKTPYLDGSSVVTATNGAYTQVDNFLDSGTTDRHYVVTVDQNDRGSITFGDGINGAVPTGSITDAYKTGGGTAGNVDPGTLTRIQGSFTDNLGNPVLVSCTNAQRVDNGTDRQTTPQIQVAAPAALRVTTRTVALEDYEINALRVPGVARALMTTSNQDPAVAENTGILYVVPTGGGTASSTILSAVLTMCTVTYPNTLTFRLTVLSAVYVPLALFVRFYKRAGFTGAQVGANLRATIAAYFAIQNPDGTPNENVDFGAHYVDANGNPSPALPLGPLFDACEETMGVRKLGGLPADFLIAGAHQDFALLPRQFPQPGSITLIDGDTGQAV